MPRPVGPGSAGSPLDVGGRPHWLVARHRLGTPGLVHCLEHPEVSLALGEFRRGWLSALLVPARHSWAGLRRRALAAQRTLVPIG